MACTTIPTTRTSILHFAALTIAEPHSGSPVGSSNPEFASTHKNWRLRNRDFGQNVTPLRHIAERFSNSGSPPIRSKVVDRSRALFGLANSPVASYKDEMPKHYSLPPSNSWQ
jgi:hypothetical protein